jgi:uncharacterized membrane protein YhaH (DUF805 family)
MAALLRLSGTQQPAGFLVVLSGHIIVSFLLVLLGIANELLLKLFALYTVAQIFPSLSLTIRRLRDSGKAWTWIFISLVPLIGGIWLIVLLAQPSLYALPT